MPRRLLILVLMLVGAVLLIVSATATSTSSVQAVTVDPPPSSPIILPEPPSRYITEPSPLTMPVELEPIDPADIFYQDSDTIIFATAGNSCGTAAELSFPPGGTGTGVNTSVSGLTQVPDDPVLSCMWGNPPDPRGYRTAWYRLTVPRNGQISINTFGSNYDTVLAVYTGTCDQLQKLACSDDHNMFASKVTMNVRRDRVYYIEVADWQAGAPQPPNLEMSVVLDPTESEWAQLPNIPLARTRHVGMTVGPYIYVIGGLSSFSGDDNYQASNRVDRYHIPSGEWGQLATMPTGGSTRIGQFNSSGVFVNGRIHIPAGDDGGPTFAGQHWALDLNQNQWLELAAVNWAAWSDDGNPVGFAATVASGNGYYLLGGTTNLQSPPPPNSVGYTFFYNATTNTWEQRAEMNTSRYSHTAAWVGGRACVAGGIHVDEDENLVLEPSAECYNPINNNWLPIASLNIARYGAGSAVGPNGKWYVFGGTSVSGENYIAVPEVEVYDPATNRWSVLGARADLGGTDSSPARTWPRGGFVGNDLWVAGGNMVVNNGESGALSLVERLYIAPRQLYIPYVKGAAGDPALINDTFALAQFLPFNQPIFQNFATSLDFFDVFYFDLAAQRVVTLDLTNIPSNHDYDLFLYNNNKSLLAESRNLAGQNEQIVRNLSPGRHYVVVERVLPVGLPDPNAHYRLELR